VTLPGRALAAAALLLGLAASALPQETAGPVAESIRERLDQWETSGRLAVNDTVLVSEKALLRLYADDGYRPYWTAEKLATLQSLLRDSEKDGLTPADYHLDALDRIAVAPNVVPGAASEDPATLANRDLLATDALTMLLHDLYLGKVDPHSLDVHWNYERRPLDEERAFALIEDSLSHGRLAEAAAKARPDHWWYGKALASLAEERAIAARGGWPAVPPGPTLVAGATGPRVVAVRRRLAATGELSGQSLDDERFDEPLAAAVRAFQEGHRLTADGSVGAATLAEMNVPVAARIVQIRVNLERGRWALHEIPAGPVVLVDIAGFEVGYLRDQKVLWNARIQVGKPYRQTPIFKSFIDHVVLSPTWTVPPTILSKDVLPAVRKDPGYLAAKKLDVLDRNGKPVDPSTIDWAQATAKNFPYMLRQGPGPENALGRVKIMFPNPFFVYLHDTPSKSLFEKDERAFSSGCIRVDRPFELVERLLDDPKTWNAETMAKEVAAGTTRTVRLPKPVPVLLMYWTIVPSDDGHTVFKRDPYGRDRRLAQALDGPPHAEARRGP
jgi:murein L,D-transpeptidase YcbB/YkuD